MRYLPLALLGLISAASSAQGGDCASILSQAEVRSVCAVPNAVLEVYETSAGECQLTAKRPGSVSALIINVNPFESETEARASLMAVRMVGEAVNGLAVPGLGNEVMGQMAETLGLQSPDAPAAADASDEEAEFRELLDLGDGGVRFVSDLSGASAVATHTVAFSAGATLVKLESSIVAGRAGVCRVDDLEVLARRMSSRL